MNCSYSINKDGVATLMTQKELFMEFIKENAVLSPNSIFSSYEVQKSAIKNLNDLIIKEAPENYIPLQELITKPNKHLFASLGDAIWNDAERMVPEYIEENWVVEFVTNNINEKMPADYKIPPVNLKYLKKLRESPYLENISDEHLSYVLSLAEAKIKEDDALMPVSNMIHILLTKLLNTGEERNFDQIFHTEIKSLIEEYPDIYGKDNIKQWQEQLRSIVYTIQSKINDIGIPITNIRMASHPDTRLKVWGHIDFVAIDGEGNPHIFEINLSKRPYSGWSSAKQATVDWQLAMKRQLVAQALPIHSTQLYIIPVVMQGFGNPALLTVDNVISRTGSDAGLGSTGRLTRVAQNLIPSRIISEYDFDKVSRLKDTLEAVLSKEYQIKTQYEDNNIELIMENAEKRFNKTGVWRRYNKYGDEIEGLTKYIEVTPESDSETDRNKAKAEFRAMIEKYVEHVNSQENEGVSTYRDAIITAIKTNQKIKTSKFSPESDQSLNRLLDEYLNDSWEVVNMLEGQALGLVVFRNKDNNEIMIFNLSLHQAYASIKPDEQSKYLYGELDAVKAMVFLNEYKNVLMPDDTYKLGQIITFNPKNARTFNRTSQEILKIFKDRMIKAGLGNDINITKNDLTGVEDMTLRALMSAAKGYEGEFEDVITRLTNNFGDKHLKDIDKELLIEFRKEMFKEFPTYINKTIKPEIDWSDRIEVIFALLQTSILAKEGIDLGNDFQNLTELSLQAADFKSLIRAVVTQDVEEYDKTEKKVQWLIGGLMWTNPEFVQSRDMRQMNSMVSSGNSSIRHKMVNMNNKTRVHTLEYYDAIRYNTFQRMTTGNDQDQHRNLFLTDENGDLNVEFKTKNPYQIDAQNALSDYERKYLQNLLLIINQYALEIPESEISKIDPSSLESLRKNDKIAKAIDSGKYFQMPLIRKAGPGKYKDAFQSHGDKWRLLSMAKDKFESMLDPRELSSQDVENIEAEHLGFFEMYDVYGNQTEDVRAEMIEDRGVNYFDLNLDTIAHRVAFSKIRKQTFDLILPTINAYMWWMKLKGGQQNDDVSKQLKYMTNQIKLAVFDEPLIDEEHKTIAAGLASARQVVTSMMLALRPALLAKEMTIGVLKNFSASALGINEEFGAKEMTQAYEKLITIDSKFSDEFNMIDRLNQFYGIANMDMATVAGKLQTSRWGASRGLSNYMFMTSTVGDYYNRMAVLIAKMIKDGSYKAHSMDGGSLVYDPTKDERFSYYLSQRNRHKDSKGNFIPKKGDEKYNQQRNLYLLTIEQINKENIVLNETKLTEEDLITQAYSNKERDSIKSYADLVYGAYDKDAQAHAGHTLYGIAFMQFLTFWPNKMRFYFGKPISAEDSPQGKVKQAFELDSEGNKVLHWYKTIDGTLDREIVTENTGDPVLIWEGTPQEGVFVSLMYAVQDIVKGDWAKLKDNQLRKNRAMFMIADGFFIYGLLKLLSLLFRAFTEDLDRDSIGGELAHFMNVTNRKVINEYHLWDNTFGSVRTEPLAVVRSIGTAKNVLETMTGDRTLKSLLSRSIGAFEFLKD